MYRIVIPNEKPLTFLFGMKSLAFGPKPLPLEKENVSMSKMLQKIFLGTSTHHIRDCDLKSFARTMGHKSIEPTPIFTGKESGSLGHVWTGIYTSTGPLVRAYQDGNIQPVRFL